MSRSLLLNDKQFFIEYSISEKFLDQDRISRILANFKSISTLHVQWFFSSGGKRTTSCEFQGALLKTNGSRHAVSSLTIQTCFLILCRLPSPQTVGWGAVSHLLLRPHIMIDVISRIMHQWRSATVGIQNLLTSTTARRASATPPEWVSRPSGADKPASSIPTFTCVSRTNEIDVRTTRRI